MSEASRKSFWPRRWVRSFAGAALATGLVGGLVAQDPPKPPDPSKLELPKTPEAPKPGTKDAKDDKPAAKERTITFRKSGERWDEVIQWYANESGLAFNSVEPPPQGTFTFVPPTDPKTKQPRQYTLSGITDVLNESLLAKNYVLIRGETTFQLWPSDKAIDPSLVRRVSLEDLKRLAVRDMVQVYLPLKILSAPDQVADVKKMMSKAGEVVALQGTNTLLMIDQAGNLRRIVEDLQESESDTGGTSEQLTHKCEYVKSRDARTHLETLLRTGDEGGRGSSGGGFDPRFGGGFDPRFGGGGFDPRMMEGGRDRRSSQSSRGVRPTNIVADDTTNTVYVNATADKVGQAKAFLLKYDAPPYPGAPKAGIGKPDWVTHTVPAGSAESYQAALNLQYRGTSVRVAALSQNQIMVYGTPDDQLAVIEFVKKGTTQSNPTFKAIAINSMDAGDAVTLLRTMFVAADKGGPVIEKHASGSGIVVKGRPEQIAEVESAIKAGIENVDSPGLPGSGNVRIITLKEGNAAALAEGIKQLMEGMGKPAPKINLPGARPQDPPPPPKPKAEPPLKDILQPGEPKKFGLGVRDLGDRTMYISEQLVDPMKPAEAKPKSGAGVTITAVGNRLIITGDDPAAVALAHELANYITKGGPDNYEVFRLKNADATEAARVLNEWFNGPQQPQGRNQNPFANIFGGGGGGRGGFGGFGQQPADATPPGQPRVRIVAEQSSNSLLVRASTLDLLTIKSMLDSVIDRGATDSNAVVKAFTLGPLQYAVATEVVEILLTVYRESTNAGATQGSNRIGGGFGGLGGFAAFGARQQPLDAMGRPKQVSLTIAADDRTNSIFGTATEAMRKDIETLVTEMEKRAKDSTTVVELVPLKGVDPNMVQSVMDAIQGRPAATGSMGGMNRGGFGQGNFGQGGFGQGNFGGFGGQGVGGQGVGGGNRGGFGGGFGTPGGGGNRGGFGGGNFGGGGNRGGGFGGGGTRGGGGRGGRFLDPDTPPGGRPLLEGPDFFEGRDMEVPQQTLLYDPYELSQAGRPQPPAAPGLTPGVEVVPPTKLAGGPAQPQHLQDIIQAQAKVTPPPKVGGPGGLELISPRGPVTVSPLTEFGAVIVTARNQADLKLVQEIVRKLEEYLRTEAATAGPKLEIVPLEYGDAVEVANTVNLLGSRAAGPQAQAGVGAFNQTQLGGSVFVYPVERRNAVVLFGPESRIDYYKTLIKQFDQPNTNTLVSFPLKKASAQQVATLLGQFYNLRYDETAQGNIIRFSYDTSTNTVFVQAGKGDLAEIRGIIERLDNSEPAAKNELRIVRLKYALAEELSNTILTAFAQNVLPQGTGIVVPTAQAGGAGGFGQGAFGQAFGQQQQNQNQIGGAFGQAAGATQPGRVQLGSQQTNTTKSVSLRFLVPGKDGLFESGYLEDVHLIPDVRSNSILVSAPEKSLALIFRVIEELDVPSTARSQVNIFTLKRADATLTANLLQQLFNAARTQGGAQQPGGQGPFGQQTTGGAGATTRPLITAGGEIAPGAGLVGLQIGVDDRTNSVIAAGSQSELDAIRAIIARLEDEQTQLRQTFVLKLRNAGAADVAGVLQTFLQQSYTIVTTNLTATNFQEVQRNVFVAAEPVSNNLLISATPQAYAQLVPVIEKLDAVPLQVSIEVLVAEVLLTNNEDFGVEIGLQSPVLFGRSVIPATSTTLTNAAGSPIPPGVTVNSTITQYAGAAFPFNNVTATTSPYNNNVNPGIVGFQGLTNYGVGRANANGVGGFVFSAGSDTVNVLIRALKTQGRIDNLTKPTLTVLDNQIGSVNVGGLYPYTTGGQFTQLGTFQPEIDQQQIGTTLTVAPRISPEGRILMRVEPSIVAPQDTLVSLGNGLFATAFAQQTVQTTVSVNDGETVVLGGLITKNDSRTENKVPWLGDLPYVGSLFRFRTQIQSRRELLVIMTPHVVRNSADSEKILMQEARKMSWVLRDVDKMYGPGGSIKSGPAGGLGGAAAHGAVGGPDGAICPPNDIHPSGAWVHPKPAAVPAPAAAPGPPVSAAPAPPPVVPAAAELPPIPTPLPEPVKAGGPALPVTMPPRGVLPGEAK